MIIRISNNTQHIAVDVSEADMEIRQGCLHLMTEDNSVVICMNAEERMDLAEILQHFIIQQDLPL